MLVALKKTIVLITNESSHCEVLLHLRVDLLWWRKLKCDPTKSITIFMMPPKATQGEKCTLHLHIERGRKLMTTCRTSATRLKKNWVLRNIDKMVLVAYQPTQVSVRCSGYGCLSFQNFINSTKVVRETATLSHLFLVFFSNIHW